MAVRLQPRHQFLDQGEDHLAHTADVVTLVSDVVDEGGGMTIEGPTMTGDLAAVSHQASGGGAKHLQGESLGMAEEEEEVVVVVAVVAGEDQMGIGMDEEGEDGDLLTRDRLPA
jgi:hypothetical protein